MANGRQYIQDPRQRDRLDFNLVSRIDPRDAKITVESFEDCVTDEIAQNKYVSEWNSTWNNKASTYGTIHSIFLITVFNNKIYGTCGDTTLGEVDSSLLEWDGVSSWILVAPHLITVPEPPYLITEVAIVSFCEFNGKLYGGTGFGDWGGARLYEWNGVDAWIERIGPYGTAFYILSMCVFNGKLYGVTNSFGTWDGGLLLEWDGVSSSWSVVAPQYAVGGNFNRLGVILVFENELYASCGPGYLLKWNGADSWILLYTGPIGYGIKVINGEMYVGGSTGGIYKWDGAKFNLLASSGYVTTFQPVIFNGRILFSTITGVILEYHESSRTLISRTATYLSETICSSLLVFNNKIYMGSGNSLGGLLETDLVPTLDSFASMSESSIVTDGGYSLRATANQTTSLNRTLTYSPDPPINLSEMPELLFDVRASREGSNFKIGLRDSSGDMQEYIPNIQSSDTWQRETWDLSDIAETRKQLIDQIIITILNADADNTIYLDNFHGYNR